MTASFPESASAPPTIETATQPSHVSKMLMHSQDTSPATIDEELVLIRTQPDISADDTISYDDEGWDSRVYLVNGGVTCYKFPRSPKVMASYGREIDALNMLGNLGATVRTQHFKALDPAGRFFSYHGLVGRQLSELMPTLDASEKKRIGREIGGFLNVLHGSRFEGAPVVTVSDEIAEYRAKYELARPIIEERFTSNEQQDIAEFFYDYMPEQMVRLGSELRLCHGDLGSYNIIVGQDGTPGIIDFGNLGYYEQSKDFIDFWDDDFLDAVFTTYGDTPNLRAKTAVRILALPAIDLVYYMGKNDKHGVGVTVDRLRESLPVFPQGSEGVIS